MRDRNPRNTETKFDIVKYGSGPWDGKWVVRRTITEDVAATLTEHEAMALARLLSATSEPS